jgi:16S rRNA processing protein RimM
MPRIEPARWIPVGVLGRPKGLQGALWLRPFNDDIASLRVGLTVRVKREGLGEKTLSIATLASDGKGITVTFTGERTREAAEALVLAEVAVRRADLAPLGEGEFYHCDMPGASVLNAAGETLGEVVEVIAYPSIDALVVRTPKGDREVPMTEALVVSVDAEAGVVVLADGALDDEA